MDRKTKRVNQLRPFKMLAAEGTGLEPATPCGASDFESDSSPFGYPPGSNVAPTPRSGKACERAKLRRYETLTGVALVRRFRNNKGASPLTIPEDTTVTDAHQAE